MLCAGRCPPGRVCASVATVTPAPCPTAHYCEVGTAEPIPCPPSTYSESENLTARSECTACTPGYWCSGGVRTPCMAATYNPLPSRSSSG
eukprot:5484775-Prymnesium_polylepis.1